MLIFSMGASLGFRNDGLSAGYRVVGLRRQPHDDNESAAIYKPRPPPPRKLESIGMVALAPRLRGDKLARGFRDARDGAGCSGVQSMFSIISLNYIPTPKRPITAIDAIHIVVTPEYINLHAFPLYDGVTYVQLLSLYLRHDLPIIYKYGNIQDNTDVIIMCEFFLASNTASSENTSTMLLILPNNIFNNAIANKAQKTINRQD